MDTVTHKELLNSIIDKLMDAECGDRGVYIKSIEVSKNMFSSYLEEYNISITLVNGIK